MITASSDGTVRVWDARSCESLLVVKPPQTASGSEPSVHSVWAHPQNPDQVFVCPRSSTVFLMTLKGQVSFLSVGQYQGSRTQWERK